MNYERDIEDYEVGLFPSPNEKFMYFVQNYKAYFIKGTFNLSGFKQSRFWYLMLFSL